MSVQTETAAAVMFSPRRIGHANLFVGELERSMHFYNKIAGFEEVFREPHIPAGFLSNGNTHHDLGLIQIQQGEQVVGRDGHVQIPTGRGVEAGLNHFGWEMECEKDLAEAYFRANEAGVDLHRKVDHQISHSIYMFDPDGNLHEFYADMMDDWREVFHGKVGEAITGGWDPEAGNYLTEGRYHEDYELRRVDQALIHPVRFTSAVLLTKNFEPMVDFFGSVAGLEVAHRTPDGAVVSFAGPKASHGVDISLVKQSGDASVHHYSYEVADEAELDRAEAALAGGDVAIEKKLDHATKRSIFVRDPDNMLCEFFVPRTADLAAIDSANDDRLYLL